jgi:antitoxin PrlF
MLLSKVTAKAQTTLPSGVRKALGLAPGDSVAYELQGDHAVIRKAPAADPEEDPALGAFLDFLERDIEEHPERLQLLTNSMVDRWRELTDDLEVDLDEPIEGPVSL